MEDDPFPWSKFLKHPFAKSLGPLLGVKICGPRGMTMHQKVKMAI
jgi:hypothetical protein